MPILVTGGAGFIGSHVVDALLAANEEVRVLDLLHPLAHGGMPDYLNDHADFVHGDVRDRETVERALHGVTAVCHQAAMVGLGVDMSDIGAFVSHNDVGTATLLETLAGLRFGGRVVLASSMVVYGEGRYECAEHGELPASPRSAADLDAGRFEPRCPRCGEPLAPRAIGEDAPLAPASVYAATKVHQEHLAFAFARETGVPVTALRYHNVYGPRMPRDTPYAGVAAIFASALARGEAPRVFEDGAQLRDFVHVRDVARANVLALSAPEPYRRSLNVASGTPRSVGEMATVLTRVHGDAPAAPVVTGEWRAGDVRHVFASPERARAALGFEAREDF
jgi:dTDP-L-rhamnose 4-epimerase